VRFVDGMKGFCPGWSNLKKQETLRNKSYDLLDLP
jgi:hypothetical protein